MAGTHISDELAHRIAAEIDAQDFGFQGCIAHLELSIGASRADLHPVLQALLPELPNG